MIRLKDRSKAVIRPIRPDDEALMIKFHQGLSETSVYFRYFGMLKLEERIAHARLTRVCTNDSTDQIALVVDREIPGSNEHEILGVARLSRIDKGDEGEIAIIITDKWHHQGLGSELIERIIEVGRAKHFACLKVLVLPENREMLRLAERNGFKITHSADGEVVADLPLR